MSKHVLIRNYVLLGILSALFVADVDEDSSAMAEIAGLYGDPRQSERPAK